MNVAAVYNNEGTQEVSAPSFAAYPGGRMAQKRRRVEDPGAAGHYDQSWTEQQYGSFGMAHQLAQHATGVAETGITLPQSTSVDDSTPAQWHYPDVASYSGLPHFAQQTDPSAYNSPWPPADGSSFAGPGPGGTAVGAGYAAPSRSGTGVEMPYFPAPSGQADVAFGDVQQQQALVQSLNADTTAMSGSGAPFNYASGNENGLARSDVPPEASAFLYEDASMHLKIQSLTILENLATQLIHTIAKANFPQIQEIMQGNDDEESQAYTTLKSLFDQTRKVYSRETPFIDAIAIQMFQPAQQEIIRKANIATFLSSILGAHDVSFFHLNEFFMETFVPLGHRLLKWQGAVFLELKTQTYISALINSDGSPEAMLDELFPSDLDSQILTRHPDAPSLSPSEQDFIDRSRARKSYLLAENSTEEAIRELPKKYQWQDFVREFASSVSKNVEGIMNTPSKGLPTYGNMQDKRTNAAAAALDTLSKRTAAIQNQDAHSNHPSAQTQTEPKKSSSAASAQRQAWTKPEEDALLDGLARVNGPHWSQILALYGRGGSMSEVLKDRNQVQLKDKARNLKLWYLKMGKEVPVSLQGVTGELKKRGGARARAALGLDGEDDERDEGEDGEARRPGKKKGKKG